MKTEKRKYVYSGKFSKKNKLNSTQTETEIVGSETTKAINTSGLTLEFSPRVFQAIEQEEVRRIESEFRKALLNSFENYITDLEIEDSHDLTTFEVSPELGKKSVNYARELG